MLCRYFNTHYIVFLVKSGILCTDSTRGQHPNGAVHSIGAPLGAPLGISLGSSLGGSRQRRFTYYSVRSSCGPLERCVESRNTLTPDLLYRGELISYCNSYVSFLCALSHFPPLNVSHKTNVPEIWLSIYYYYELDVQNEWEENIHT